MFSSEGIFHDCKNDFSVDQPRVPMNAKTRLGLGLLPL
jgi:hypothetical protein